MRSSTQEPVEVENSLSPAGPEGAGSPRPADKAQTAPVQVARVRGAKAGRERQWPGHWGYVHPIPRASLHPCARFLRRQVWRHVGGSTQERWVPSEKAYLACAGRASAGSLGLGASQLSGGAGWQERALRGPWNLLSSQPPGRAEGQWAHCLAGGAGAWVGSPVRRGRRRAPGEGPRVSGSTSEGTNSVGGEGGSISPANSPPGLGAPAGLGG